MRPLLILSVLLINCLILSAQDSVQPSAATAQPKLVEAVAPDYPDEAISLRAEGRVVVAVKVSRKGLVNSAKALWGPAIFRQAALDAAKRWRFVENQDRQKRIAELAFVFLVADKRGEGSISFLPPNQIEVVADGPDRTPGERVANNRLGEDDENPEVIRSVAPVYPVIAVQARASGPVKVEVRIDYKGKVIAASVKSGHPLLQSSSVAAARRWEFTSSASKKSD